MSIFSFLGTSNPRTPYQLERDIEDALEGGNAAWDQEHDGQGHHTDITADSIGSRTAGTLLQVTEGLRFMVGPWLFENDGNNPQVAVLQPTQLTANANNYGPGGLDKAVIVELTSSTAVTITGFVNRRRRRLLILVNRGNNTITLAHNSGSSTAQYRMYFAGQGSIALRSGDWIWLYYDAGSEIWRGGGLTGIRSVQRGVMTITAGNATKTQTLGTTLIDTSKAIVHHLGSTGATAAEGLVYLSNLTTTTIDGTRSGTTNDAGCAYEVVEYY